VFRIGIARNARPIERLKKRYRDFQASPSSSKPASITFKSSGSQEIDALRRNPFKNYDSPPLSSSSNPKPPSSSSSSAPQASSSSPSAHGHYAPMLAPPVPGRRPEKLRFNLSLLFTEDGFEYSAAEVRARSMGLLNKKWGPPPRSESRETVRVNFNDDGARSTQNMEYGKRKSIVTVGSQQSRSIRQRRWRKHLSPLTLVAALLQQRTASPLLPSNRPPPLNPSPKKTRDERTRTST